MRLSDLLGAEVRDGGGVPIGRVADVTLRRDGPELDGFGPAYAVAALRVTAGRTSNLFGYDRPDAGGPALVRWVLRRLHRGDRSIPWDDVAAVGDGVVDLRQP